MKKIIVVISSHTPSLFWFRIDMLKEFVNIGCQVYALGNEDEDKWKSSFENYQINYIQIYVKRNGLNPIQDLKTFASIKKKLSIIRPDKIFVYQAKSVIYGTIAANKLGIKEVYPLIAGVGSIFISKGVKSKIIRCLMKQLYRYSLKNCPVVFFQNSDDVNLFRNLGIIKRQNIALLHGSGVNIKTFHMLPYPEETAFICISRLIRDKGVYEYLEACRKIKREYPNVKCMLVGPYDTNPSALTIKELQPFIDAGIEYYGEQKDIRPYLEKASVFILPSYREGTPKTVLEAMACGRAIITTDAPGCKETVVNSENGFLVPIKDVNAIYEKMKFFIENKDVVQIMGNKGRRMAEDKFEVGKINQMICEYMQI